VDRLGRLHLTLVAEHGGWMREAGGQWRSAQIPNEEWKRTIRPILDRYSDRTPGAFVEEKDFSLVWHYRRADPMQGAARARELRETLMSLMENMDAGVFEGNRVLEVRRLGISKGRVVARLVAQEQWDFLLAAGDDTADKEMFAALPPDAVSVKVGAGVSRASFHIDSFHEMRLLLKELTGYSVAAPAAIETASAGAP
jgi:trehalose 6-phosphate synthase/phosphatase